LRRRRRRRRLLLLLVTYSKDACKQLPEPGYPIYSAGAGWPISKHQIMKLISVIAQIAVEIEPYP
jgi:hypothetical protein